MSIEAARRLVADLDQKIRDEQVGEPLFNSPNVTPFSLNKDGFRLIRKVQSSKKVAYIDGGNQEIVGAPNFSVQVNRTYFGLWSGAEREFEKVLPRRIEFFTSTHSRSSGKQIIYDTSMFPVKSEHKSLLPDEDDISFDSCDRTIAISNQRADIERVASIARRFAEWQLAEQIARNELSSGDLIVMDRTLQTNFKHESKYLAKLYATAKEKGVVISGLSKTSALFTDTGLSLIGAVDKLAHDSGIKQEWYYPIAEARSKDHNAVILAVKLCAPFDRVFRFEIQREQFNKMSELELNEILTQLVRNSCDVSFPGYPYGLIDADRLARVSYDEIEYYRGLLLSQISNLGKWEKFARHIRARDAHDVLNMLVS